ncbi:MAG: cobalt-zinc-cadmium resistance protein CzcC, partial [Alphaproteobacteria bacterium]
LAAGASERAAEAGVAQAGRRPNPTVEVLSENVSGSGPYSSLDRAETTVSFSQPLELGGDRHARRTLAERDLATARLSSVIRRLDLFEEVEVAFVEAQAAQARCVVAEERLGVARGLAEAVARRVGAARDPLMAGARAQTRLAEAEIEAEAARRGAEAAMARLASYWGSGAERIDLASFERMADRPLSSGADAPDLALATAEEERAKARIEIERARGVPDPNLQAGWRRFSDTDDTALTFGVSIPLQLWDRNSGGVSRARAERDRAGFETRARAQALARQQATLATQRAGARHEVEALDARVIPNAEEALRLAHQGYSRGAFSYLDVLEAQRSVSDARLRRIAALRTYHLAEAALARLTGAHADVAPVQEQPR